MQTVGMTIRCLSVHALYRCGHSGACCTAGWPIPVEAETLQVLDRAVAEERLRPARRASHPWRVWPDAPAGTPAVLQADVHGCVFFDRSVDGCCRVHRTLGPAALPVACREFPRVSVIEPRGTSVTLSHYCPTAADLLNAEAPVDVVTGAPAFPEDTTLTGLDVRDGLPPLLRPDMLMDWSSWWDFERRAVALIARPEASAATNLARLASVVERIRPWAPTEDALCSRIERAFFDATAARHGRADGVSEQRLRDVLAAIPENLRPPAVERTRRPSDGVIRRFVAAHAFASWTAHLGRGLRSWLRSLETTFALVDAGLGVRQADLLLRHLADPGTLAATFSRAESE